jgi:hypothetical protein
MVASARFEGAIGRCRVDEQQGSRGRILQDLLEEMWDIMAYTAKTKGPRFSTIEALVAMLILEFRELKKTLAGLSAQG